MARGAPGGRGINDIGFSKKGRTESGPSNSMKRRPMPTATTSREKRAGEALASAPLFWLSAVARDSVRAGPSSGMVALPLVRGPLTALLSVLALRDSVLLPLVPPQPPRMSPHPVTLH